MTQKVINPWSWQDALGFAQAVEVTGAARVLYCSGQTSISADGAPQHPGDIRAQVGAALDNLEVVLAQAGLTVANVVRLNVYTTDVDGLFQHWDDVIGRFNRAGCRPASTLLGVTRLALPDLLVEIEATAAA